MGNELQANGLPFSRKPGLRRDANMVLAGYLLECAGLPHLEISPVAGG